MAEIEAFSLSPGYFSSTWVKVFMPIVSIVGLGIGGLLVGRVDGKGKAIRSAIFGVTMALTVVVLVSSWFLGSYIDQCRCGNGSSLTINISDLKLVSDPTDSTPLGLDSVFGKAKDEITMIAKSGLCRAKQDLGEFGKGDRKDVSLNLKTFYRAGVVVRLEEEDGWFEGKSDHSQRYELSSEFLSEARFLLYNGYAHDIDVAFNLNVDGGNIFTESEIMGFASDILCVNALDLVGGPMSRAITKSSRLILNKKSIKKFYKKASQLHGYATMTKKDIMKTVITYNIKKDIKKAVGSKEGSLEDEMIEAAMDYVYDNSVDAYIQELILSHEDDEAVLYEEAKGYARQMGLDEYVDALEWGEGIKAEIDDLAGKVTGITEALEFCVSDFIGESNDALYEANLNIRLSKPLKSPSIAWKKPTFQSSTYIPQSGGNKNPFDSSHATDGIINQHTLSLSSTAWQANPWWRVDLEEQYSIELIVIYNRDLTPCSGSPINCSTRLAGFRVTVYNGSKVTWTHIDDRADPPLIITLPVDPSVVGDMVEISLDGSNRILTLAEVEVFGSLQLEPSPAESPTVSPTVSPGFNIAQNQPTSQSSTYIPQSGNKNVFDSSHATDGITNQQTPLSSTAWQANPWWQVDLERQYSINRIVIYNRDLTPCSGSPINCSTRLAGFRVTVYNGSKVTWTYKDNRADPPLIITLSIPESVVGDVVEISLDGSNRILTLAEVEVFGTSIWQ